MLLIFFLRCPSGWTFNTLAYKKLSRFLNGCNMIVKNLVLRKGGREGEGERKKEREGGREREKLLGLAS